MHKIPLRVFYRKIEELIVEKQYDEAISCAEYLLEKYPKNIAVYKLLGKAFLEKQEFDFANTIFVKILRVEPDDFVSHIGISIIAESFGNLEKSLISMRRAYELEPSNESLQTEVKRLQEAKDGVAPDQVRLTRGALIKMYSHSQLVEQAIAEARLGIQESPNRIDYKIHLASMLYTSGMKIKAIETCIDIINTLPYCKPALIILYRSIAPLDKTSDSTVYKIRLAEIDPYFSFIKPDTNSVDDIPDIAIMVEEREKPINPIENFDKFIEEAWKRTTQYDDLPSSKEQTEDWTSIIEDAVSNKSIGAPISDTSYEEVVFPSGEGEDVIETHQQKPPPIITKKDKLRRKLGVAQKDTRDEKIIPEVVISLDNMQKIKDLPEKPEKLVTQSFKSIEGGNMKFANQRFNKLIRKNIKLKEFPIQIKEIHDSEHDDPEDVGICLYLKWRNDETIRYGFSHVSNFCYKPKKAQPVRLSYQKLFCLTEKYTDCPVFQQEKIKRLPSDIRRKRKFKRDILRENPFLMIILFLVLGIITAIIIIGASQMPSIGVENAITLSTSQPQSEEIVSSGSSWNDGSLGKTSIPFLPILTPFSKLTQNTSNNSATISNSGILVTGFAVMGNNRISPRELNQVITFGPIGDSTFIQDTIYNQNDDFSRVIFSDLSGKSLYFQRLSL